MFGNMISWLQVLHAVGIIGGGVTSRQVADYLQMRQSHAQVVLNRLYKWGLVSRTKSEETGRGRPSFIYSQTEKGFFRIEKADRELEDGWWNYPDTRPKSQRRRFEPLFGSPEWEQWRSDTEQTATNEMNMLLLRILQINGGAEAKPGELLRINHRVEMLGKSVEPKWFTRPWVK